MFCYAILYIKIAEVNTGVYRAVHRDIFLQ